MRASPSSHWPGTGQLLRCLLLPWVVFLATASLCSAQIETANLSGLILSEGGEPIRNAVVTVTHVIANTSNTTRSNDQGVYLLTGLLPGTYRITVERFGFKVSVRSDVQLHVQSQVSENIVLQLGYSSETVSSLSMNWSNATAPATSALLDRTFPNDIPINGRSFQPLLKLVPGHVTAQTYFTSPGQSSFNGRRTTENYVTIDGVSANFGVAQGADVTLGEGAGESQLAVSVVGGTSDMVSLDEIEELRVQGWGYAAQSGRLPGAQITLVTRSGTNEFHGKAFEYFRNDALDAPDWFSNYDQLPTARERQNDYGGTFSGPLLKQRSFFFASRENLRLVIPQIRSEVVPSLAARQEAVPAMRPLLNAFPLPNRPLSDPLRGTFATNPENLAHLNTTSLRLDVSPTASQSYFLRGSYSPSTQTQRGAFNYYTTSTSSITQIKVATLTFGATFHLAAASFDDLRLGLGTDTADTSADADNFGGAIPATLSYLFSSYTPAANPGSNFAATLLPDNSGLYLGRDVHNTQRQWTVVDGLHWTVGRHELGVGIDARWLLPVNAFRAYTGNYAFIGIGAAISGSVDTARVQSSQSGDIHLLFRNASVYLQDSWRPTPRFTLTYGLRWEGDSPPSDRSDLPLRNVLHLDAPASLTLAPASPLWRSQKTNFAPRIGAAYGTRLRPGWETQFRGSFGLFYGLASSAASRVAQGAPYLNTRTFTNISFPLSDSDATPIPSTLVKPYSLIYGFPQDLHAPRISEWSATTEQRLGGQMMALASYIGSSGARLLHREILLPQDGLNPDFSSVEVVNNHSRSTYNALQFQFERRFGHGPRVWANYTWSHSLDTASNVAHPSPYFLTYDPERDYASSDFDIRHNFSTAVTYAIPAPQTRWLADLFGGWSVTTLAYVTSAMPINVVTGNDPVSLGYTKSYYRRPNANPGVPLYLRGRQYPGGRAINPNAFTSSTAAFQGDLGRNAVRGFGMWQDDLSLQREISVGLHLVVLLRAEVLNVGNHPNFGNPGAGSTNTNVLSATGFGISSMTLAQSLGAGGADGGFNPIYQVGGPRAIQLVGHIRF